MSERTILLAFAFFALFASLSLSSAYLNNYGPYYANGKYDSYSYSSSSSQGYYGFPGYTKTTDYNRLNSEQILPDGTLEKTTHYVKVNRETPNYPMYNNMYYNGYQPNYNSNYNTNYYPMNSRPSYQNNPNYNNYNSYYNNDYWYQKYWDNKYYPTYYARQMPMYYSGYAW